MLASFCGRVRCNYGLAQRRPFCWFGIALRRSTPRAFFCNPPPPSPHSGCREFSHHKGASIAALFRRHSSWQRRRARNKRSRNEMSARHHHQELASCAANFGRRPTIAPDGVRARCLSRFGLAGEYCISPRVWSKEIPRSGSRVHLDEHLVRCEGCTKKKNAGMLKRTATSHTQKA